MSSEIAINVENLSKCYQIYEQPRDRLKQFVLPRLQKLARLRARQYFHEFWALKNLSFTLKKGQTLGIVGRNGSGKSTLLQIICGTLSPTNGTIQTNGRIAALLELGSGFNPEFSGRENVYLNGAILGLTREEIDSCFDDIAAFADIGEFIEQPVKMYSSGMMVRLAFSVQAMICPEILIIDEALAVGDEKFQRKCFARLDELKNKGTTIIFVSHSAPQVIELCDQALFLEQGMRVILTNPSDAIRAYQKLIYAPKEQQAQLLDQYTSADRAETAALTSRQQSEKPNPTRSIGSDKAVDSFDPGLTPDTTLTYPIQGAEIQSIQIHGLDRQAVNLLQPCQNYRFVVTGRFLSNAKRIYFGVHIKSIAGVEITGQRHPPEGKYIENISAGERFQISFEFKAVLLPGVYFVGGGIWSYQEPNCLHRVLDAIMFRIVQVQNPISFGYVDAATNEAILELF